MTLQATADANSPPPSRGRYFKPAYDTLAYAKAAKNEAIDQWTALLATDGNGAAAGDLTAGRVGLTDAGLSDGLVAAVESFFARIEEAFDRAVLLGADFVMASPPVVFPPLTGMPMWTTEAAFEGYLESGVLFRLRPEQIGLIRTYQPFTGSAGDAEQDALRRSMEWLLATRAAAKSGIRPRLKVVAGAASTTTDLQIEVGGGPVGQRLFSSRADDLIELASIFIECMEVVLGFRRPYGVATRQFSIEMRNRPVDLWQRVELSEIADANTRTAFGAEDVSLATHRDPQHGLSLLVKVGDSAFLRRVPQALEASGEAAQGTAVEDALLSAASIWGLPDFVFYPKLERKGSKAQREIGDGTIISGGKALAVQSKSRTALSAVESRERRWLLKNSEDAARQAAGTVRRLCTSPVTLQNGRGRELVCDGKALQWVGVVVLDHESPPENVVPIANMGSLPVVVLLRRDWDFLFDQLRSISAVVDYLHRAAVDGVRPIGDEPVRYYELADADELAQHQPAPWTDGLPGEVFTYPTLPKAPVSSAEHRGHSIFRVILEDLAETELGEDESQRLETLAMLDRFDVGNRAELGRHLLDLLFEVRQTPPGTMLWRSRRVLQDGGRLHLGFGVATHFTEVHREAFGQWAMLRHHQYTEMVHSAVLEPTTVAVMLTPRYDGLRMWDTSAFHIRGVLDIDPGDLSRMAAFWDADPDPSSL